MADTRQSATERQRDVLEVLNVSAWIDAESIGKAIGLSTVGATRVCRHLAERGWADVGYGDGTYMVAITAAGQEVLRGAS